MARCPYQGHVDESRYLCLQLVDPGYEILLPRWVSLSDGCGYPGFEYNLGPAQMGGSQIVILHLSGILLGEL